MQKLLTYKDLEPIFQLTKKQLQGKVYSGFFVINRDYIKIGREVRFYPEAIKKILTPKAIDSPVKVNPVKVSVPNFTPPPPKKQKKPKGCLINFR